MSRAAKRRSKKSRKRSVTVNFSAAYASSFSSERKLMFFDETKFDHELLNNPKSKENQE